MKILLISPTDKGIGGIAQHVNGLSQFLTNQNHKVNIISSSNTFTIPVKGLRNPSFMLSSFLKTRSIKGNDIVHAHNIPAALAMKKTSGKKILSLHGIYSQQITEIHGKIYSNISKNYDPIIKLDYRADAWPIFNYHRHYDINKIPEMFNSIPETRRIAVYDMRNKKENYY